MNHFLLTSAVFASMALSACDKSAPVTPPPTVIVTPSTAGPAGPAGPAGAQGTTGSTGSMGAPGMPGAPASAASTPTN